MLERILSSKISPKCRAIISDISSENYRSKTSAIWGISRKLNVPESTVRWNVNKMISAGILENNGSLKVGRLGKLLVKINGESNGK